MAKEGAFRSLWQTPVRESHTGLGVTQAPDDNILHLKSPPHPPTPGLLLGPVETEFLTMEYQQLGYTTC